MPSPGLLDFVGITQGLTPIFPVVSLQDLVNTFLTSSEYQTIESLHSRETAPL